MSGPAISMTRWVHDADSLLGTMPDSIQQIIRQTIQNGTFDSPEYQGAVMSYYAQFVARKQPWSADIESTLTQMNPEIYAYMNGPSEFTVTGTLKDYDGTDKLKTIKQKTLFTCGEFDEATPTSTKFYQSMVPGSELSVIPNAGHLTMQDNPDGYNQVLRDFLKRADSQ